MKRKSKSIKKCIMTFVLIAVMVLGAVPIEGLVMVAHAVEKNLSGSESYTAKDGDVLTGSTFGRVTIESDAEITLRDVTITGGIVCEGSAEITLVGTNKVTGTNGTNGANDANDANDNGTDTAGIWINGILTIKGDGSLTATGGEGATDNGAYVADGGHGIAGALVVESDSVSITAIGGNGKKGGDGIRLELDPTKEYREKAALKVTEGSPIIQATGGNATDGNGGRGISTGTAPPSNCYALLIASGSPQITSTGGNSSSGKAGDGIYGPVTITTDSDIASVLAIHGDGKEAYAISGATTVSAGFAAFNRMSEDAPWKIDSDINGDQTTEITSEHFVIENKYGRIFKSYCCVVLDGNGGSGIIVDPMYYGIDDTMTLPANTYTRNGYSFTGWNTKEDGSGKPYADGAAITLSAGATDLDEYRQLILYAQWEKYPDPVITRSPAVISGLVYNGKAQVLITEGEVTGGTMQYAIGKDATTEPTENWSTSIPTATDAGTYYVWYKAKGDENHYDSDAKAIEVKIGEAVTPSIAFDTPSMNLKIGDEQSIKVIVVPEDAKITWTSDNETVATVDESGKVKAISEGTATITGKITVDDKDYSAECKVTVSKDAPEEKTRVEPKELTDDSISKELKEKGYTSPEIIRTKLEEDLSLGSDEKKANSSLYELVLEVSTDGGKTWVPATTQNFPKDGLEVTIPYPVTQDGTQTNGTDYIFRVAHLVGTTVGDVEAGTVETPEVTNTEDGILVIFHGLSPVMITWEKKTSPEPTPTDISVTLNLSETYLTQGMEKALKATTKPEGSTVTWGSSDNSVAYVDGRGVVIGLKPGTATITATIAVDGKEYSASCKVTVVPAGFIPSGKSDGSHTHKFVWVTIEATEDSDGELRYQCETCGEIQTRVPLTAYNVFNKNTTEKIRKAPKDATVRIETNKWISFHKMVMEALAERKDVTLEISFLDGEYKGNRCTVVIPKGTDTMSLVDKNGFTGFLYLGGKFGMKTN